MGTNTKKHQRKTARKRPAVHVLTELDQVKVLADPLRLKILEALCEEARTTKQVAEVLEEKPTKLYHHIEALERTGLIRLEETRQKRGTLEKYYRTIAHSFRADERLFDLGPEPGDPASWQELGASLLDTAAAEVRKLEGTPEETGAMIAGLRIRAGVSQIAELQRQLEEWIESVQELEEWEADEERADFRLALAFYPAQGKKL